MNIYLFDELVKGKLRIVKNHKIREIIDKPNKGETFINHFRLILKEKDKMSEIYKISKKIDLDKDDYNLFRSIIGSIKFFDEITIDYLTCYISYIEGSKDLNDNREIYMKGYEEMFVKKNKESINNFDQLHLNILDNTGLNKEIFQDLIDNKIEIIKNYYYRQVLSDTLGKTHIDKLINYIKSRDSITNINELTKKSPEFLFEKIISTIDNFDDWTLEYLTVYSSIIKVFNEFDFRDFKDFVNKLKWKQWRYDTMYNYDDTFYTINIKENWNISNSKKKYDKLIVLMKKDERITSSYTCKGSKKYIFDMNLKDIKKKIKKRGSELVEIDRKGNKILWRTGYNNKIYNLVSNLDKVYICKDLTPHTEQDYEFFTDFIEEAYSPIYNAMEQSNNLPSGSSVYKELRRRKSLIRIDSLKNIPENSRVGKLIGPDNRNVAYTLPRIKEKLKTIIEEPTVKNEKNAIVKNNHYRTGDILTDIMKCMKNDRFTKQDLEKAKKNYKNGKITKEQLTEFINGFNDNKIIWGQSTANYHREPFIKYVLHFPTSCDSSDDSKLLHTIKRELNNVLVCIIEKNYIDKNKEYFLIGSEGGGDMHFDYALYAFTESQLDKSENNMMIKENLWKKLEWKSNEKAKSISGLTGFITKSIDKLFYTFNKTFYKDFDQFKNNKKWLKKHINNNEYFTKAIENILKGQKNKIFLIWNVDDKKIYLDEFKSDELIVKRINKIPQIQLDEDYFNKNGNIKINITMKKENIELTLDGTSFNFNFKPVKDRKNIYIC